MEMRLAPILSFVFFFSGFAGLIYQVVWQRLLTLYYGVGPVSTTIIVSVYMLGLGAGYLLGGLLAERVTNKTILYFSIELSLGFFGLASLPIIAFLGQHTAGSGYVLSFFYIFMFLSIPTTLMGMTLPVLMKIFNRYAGNFLHSISLLYFINTIGASVGALFAGYVVITFFGLDTGIYTAAAINAAMAFVILWTGTFRNPHAQTEDTTVESHPEKHSLGKIAWLLVCVSGFLAIGYEIVWFRVIGILVKDSPYAFSSILSVYLLGIAIGSFYTKKYLGRIRRTNHRNLYFVLQVLLSFGVSVILIGYFYLTQYSTLGALTQLSFGSDVHPLPPDHSGAAIQGLFRNIYLTLDVFFWPMVFVFIPTLIMGASLPLVSSLAISDPHKEGRTVGTVYFFNTIGNLSGGIVTGFLLLPWIGTESTMFLFVSAGFMYILFIDKLAGRPFPGTIRIISVMAAIVACFLLFPQNGQLYRVMHSDPFGGSESHFGEGIDSVVVTYRKGESVRNFINGQGHGYRPGLFFYAEALEAMKYARKTENVLLIGFGAGSIFEVVQKVGAVRNITIVELCPTSISNLKKIPLYKEMLSDGRIRMVIDDGRRYLNTTKDVYDLVLADPSRVTTAYSNNIHSREFFELVNKRLSPDGIFMLGGLSNQGIIGKTLGLVFPYVRGYFSFFLASRGTFEHVDKRYDELLNAFSKDTRDGILGVTKYLGDRDYIANKMGDAPVNLDLKPRTEYYLRSYPAELDGK
jgi:spermidine synthase